VPLVLVKGFRFGMLLQFAVGPVAHFIFQTALMSGFMTASTGVIEAVKTRECFTCLA